MDVNYYKQYEPIFGAWKIKNKLGEGNFGAVYEIEREDFGTTYRAALKTITIPKTQAELDSILDDGMDATSAESYLQQFVEKIVSEFVLMSKLKGNSHIVSYEDHQVIKHKDGIGWDILIRMELLTPMMSYMKTTSITKRDVIKLGIDMCRALELCQKYNIIHRDIKPENIFISDSGDFKLGDFGIAKEVEKTQSGLTKTGTQTYMAPEVYKGQPYGSSVDLYSLGVVLYRLLNHNRAPFMPQYPNPISYSDRERALIMRMGGHHFPAPSGVEEGCRLAEIAMRACSFNPDDRYSSPTQMREDLEAIMYSEGEGILMFPSGDTIDIKSVNYVSNSKNPNRTEHLRDEQTEIMGFDDATEVMGADDPTEVIDYDKRLGGSRKTKNNKPSVLKVVIAIVSVAVFCICLAGYIAWNNRNSETAQIIKGECSDTVRWELDKSTGILTVTGKGSIPSNIGNGSELYGYEGDLTGEAWGEYYQYIEKAVIKGEIKSVGEQAFAGLPALRYVDMTDSVVEHIEEGAFFGCTALDNVLFPDTLESIGYDAFRYCSSIERIVTDNVKTIASDAFTGCDNLENVVLNEIETIESAAFAKCPQLKEIILPESLRTLEMNMLFAFDEDYLEKILYLGTKEQWNTLVIPDEYDSAFTIVCSDGVIGEEAQKDKQEENKDEQQPEQQNITQQTYTQQPVQQPVQQQPVQQPVQQQPVQQQPVQQQPQQTTPPASNPAGMPEVYIDFD